MTPDTAAETTRATRADGASGRGLSGARLALLVLVPALVAAFIVAGLVIGKPLGFIGATALAVNLGLATKPAEYSWRQLAGAGALAGIGFTMSLFIAGQAFTVPQDFAAAKIAVFSASVVSAVIGVALLWSAEAQPASVAATANPHA